MDNRKENQAIQNFENGMNCAQAVISVYAEELGLNLSTALQLTSSLGGGIARKQEMCGALNGAALVIGLMYGNKTVDDQESKDRAGEITRQFLDKIEPVYGGLTCKHILKASLQTQEDRDNVKSNNLTKLRCNPCISSTIAMLEELKKKK